MNTDHSNPDHEERLRRWRLILGGGNVDGTNYSLMPADQPLDVALSALYGNSTGEGELGSTLNRKGSMQSSAPSVSRWLGDIREYFPATVIEVMQKDAIEKVGLGRMLSEPEILETIEPDVHLVASLLSLNKVIPEQTKATARIVVKKVVDALVKKLEAPMRQALIGSLNRARRNTRPRYAEVDWLRTIRRNLKHYQPDHHTIIPEVLVGFSRKRSEMREVILCIDQSGSMAASMVYASIFGAVMAALPTIKTHLIVFDTSVVDLTADLHDPVELLFGTTLGGGTNIAQALDYCRQLITRPTDTTLVLISDLYEGGNHNSLLKRTFQLVNSGVQMVTLLALNDYGAPSFDHKIAAEFATLGIPAFACTPDLFPELMAAALNRNDIILWAAKNDINIARPDSHQSQT
jgi:Mg-chelatase subunit ChlD